MNICTFFVGKKYVFIMADKYRRILYLLQVMESLRNQVTTSAAMFLEPKAPPKIWDPLLKLFYYQAFFRLRYLETSFVDPATGGAL